MGADAGWWADPSGRHEMRFWNGSAWTDHVSDGGNPGSDALAEGEVPPPPMPTPAADDVPPPPPTAPAGGKASWKDKLKSAAQQAAQQGKQLADQAKTRMAEQQAKRVEQFKDDPDTLWFSRHGHRRSAQEAGRAARPGHPHRRRVRGPEGQAARPLTLDRALRLQGDVVQRFDDRAGLELAAAAQSRRQGNRHSDDRQR